MWMKVAEKFCTSALEVATQPIPEVVTRAPPIDPNSAVVGPTATSSEPPHLGSGPVSATCQTAWVTMLLRSTATARPLYLVGTTTGGFGAGLGVLAFLVGGDFLNGGFLLFWP